jgi:DNA-binding FadR family transcriptional regulator
VASEEGDEDIFAMRAKARMGCTRRCVLGLSQLRHIKEMSVARIAAMVAGPRREAGAARAAAPYGVKA